MERVIDNETGESIAIRLRNGMLWNTIEGVINNETGESIAIRL